ncbi:MAG: polysaccharide biosynthesis C-terminal domain-containing protein [Calditrichia bacterium]
MTVFPVLAVAFGTGGLGKLYTFYLTAQGAGKAIRNISIMIVICSILLNIILIPTIGILGAAIARLLTYILDFGLLLFFYRQHQKIKTANVQ